MILAIITGTSRGIGLELKNLLVARDGYFVIGVSRSEEVSNALNYNFLQGDLATLEMCNKVSNEVDKISNESKFSKIILVNNAGTLGEVDKSINLSNESVFKSVSLNLTAPIVLLNSIVKISVEKGIPVEVVNISSGAAVNPYFGWEVYCASKAGLLMASQVLAKEIEELKLNAKVWSLRPGVVDTQMQEQIRKTDDAKFIHVQKFKDLKSDGKLLPPEVVASFIANAINDDRFANGGFYDIRDFL